MYIMLTLIEQPVAVELYTMTLTERNGLKNLDKYLLVQER